MSALAPLCQFKGSVTEFGVTPVDHHLNKAIVVISDLVETEASLLRDELPPSVPPLGARAEVSGGYLERLPLAMIRAGRARFGEIWHHHRGHQQAARRDSDVLTRRAFPLSRDGAPFHSDAMVEFIHTHGAPRVLVVLGLGVSAELLDACRSSTIIYNSIDVPALRVPPEISWRFDLVVTGSQWQSDDVLARHPEMPVVMLPVGPEFASPETFFPIAGPKPFDVVYVAAAQPYKRHDILFAAMARSRRPLRALCVMGYGEEGGRLRNEARDLEIDVEFVGPPGVTHAEVNRLMNLARLGVVCGFDDGAPAILTEYMLAGLPVVANAGLRCGLQYIRPETGIAAPADRFEEALIETLDRSDFRPRQTVIERWAWPHSVQALGKVLDGLPAALSNPVEVDEPA